MTSEKMKILFARVSNLRNPRNTMAHVPGIVIAVKEHEGVSLGGHRSYIWYDMETANDLHLLPENYKELDEAKLNDWLQDHIEGTHMKIKVDESVIKEANEAHGENQENLIKKIFYLIRAFEKELDHELHLSLQVFNWEQDVKEGAVQEVKIRGSRIRFPHIYASDGGFSRYIITMRPDIAVTISPGGGHPQGKIHGLVFGNDSYNKDERATRIFEHYKKQIEQVLAQLQHSMTA